MRNKEIVFMPLGGAEKIGASCYYLRLGRSNVLLDCGAQATKSSLMMPDFSSLVTSRYMDSLHQLDHVYISHAHNDHIGYLAELLQLAPQAAYYMTPLTRQLSEYRLQFQQCRRQDPGQEAVEYLLAGCAEVSYMQSLEHRDYKVSFYPAGHIPGAMMTLIEYRGRRLLYTGDYSLHSQLASCVLPEKQDIDVLLLCGLHAMQPSYSRGGNTLDRRVQESLHYLSSGCSVYIQVIDDSRVIEVLLALNQSMQRQGLNYPVYLEAEAMQAVELMERLRLPVLRSNNFSRLSLQALRPHIVLGRKNKEQVPWNYRIFDSNYTLHEDYPEMKEFIKRINPRQAYIVHYDSSHHDCGNTIEQDLMYDADCRTQVTFARAGETYII